MGAIAKTVLLRLNRSGNAIVHTDHSIRVRIEAGQEGGGHFRTITYTPRPPLRYVTR